MTLRREKSACLRLAVQNDSSTGHESKSQHRYSCPLSTILNSGFSDLLNFSMVT